MLPLLLALVLFLYFALVGYALVVSLRRSGNVLQDLLLAPMVGLSATLVLVFLLNRAGSPVQAMALFVGLGLLALAAALLRRARPPMLPLRYLPFAAVLVMALLLSGWPMLLHGFDWIAFFNGDMLTLSAGAQFLLHHALFDAPDSQALAEGRDYSLYSWYLYAAGMHRVGNEMLLAWVAAIARLRPDQVYMSLTLALHLALVSVTGALVLQSRRHRGAALLACFLLALSALSTQAVMNQLSSQIGGLAYLAAGATFLLRPYREMPWRRLLGDAGLIGLVGAGMLLYYPEMTAFLALSFVVYLASARVRRGALSRPMLAVLGLAAACALLLINTHVVPTAVHTLSAFSAAASADPARSVFPFFLKPIGLAILWGFSLFNFSLPEPWTSVGIVAGALLLGGTFVLALREARQGTPVAMVASVMLGLTVYFFVRKSDFGLFKLAFYLQPFVLATLAVGWFALVRSPVARIAPLVAIAFTGCAAQGYYAARSADLTRSPVAVWKGSTLKVKGEFERLLRDLPAQTLVVDAPNFLLARFQALAGYGRHLIFMTDMERAMGRSPSFRPDAGRVLALHQALRPEVVRALRAMEEDEAVLDGQRMISSTFDLKRGGGGLQNGFRARRLPLGDEATLVTPTGLQSIFNRRRLGVAPNANFLALPLRDVADHLSFVHSDLGQYYVTRSFATSYWQLEPDHFYPRSTMAGAGAIFLFRIINPSPSPRLVLEITSTLNGDGAHLLPPAAAVGEERTAFPLLGRGSARTFSPPLQPKLIEGAAFVSIDMNAEPKLFPVVSSGLQALYGSALRLDARRLVGFVRDISLVSEREYQRLEAPVAVSQFPADLANPALEYSGVYEDGWLSEASYFMLSSPVGAATLRLEGSVPRLDDASFRTELVVIVDGKRALERTLGPGAFNLAIPVDDSGAARRRIELRFSRYQRVADRSARVIAAKLLHIGFQAAPGG